MRTLSKHQFIFFLGGGILTGVLYFLIALTGGGPDNITFYMFIYFETFLVMLFCYYIINIKDETVYEKGEVLFQKVLNKIHITASAKEAKYVLIIVLFGVLFRLILFTTEPVTSPDVYRYLWEGKVINKGFNPYLSSPESEALTHLRDEVYEKVTFKHIPAVYPPAAQYVFIVSNFLFDSSLIGLKVFYLICEIISMIFILKLLSLKNIPLNRVILYAWLPLPVMEYFINAHIDPLIIVFIIVFVFYTEKNSLTYSAVFLALSFLSKLVSLILLPLVIKQFGFKKSFSFIMIFLAVLFAGYFPFVYDDINVLTAITKYLSHWEFNASIYYLIKMVAQNGVTARLICFIGLVLSVLLISYKYKDFSKAVYTVLIVFIVFAATLYPWYLGWIAVLNPLFVYSSVTSLLFAINFSNFTPLAPEWKEFTFVLLIQYIPFYVLIVYDCCKSVFIQHKNKN